MTSQIQVMKWLVAAFTLMILTTKSLGVHGWTPSPLEGPVARRDMIHQSILGVFSFSVLQFGGAVSSSAIAAEKPSEFIDVGTQAPPPEGSSPFITLENGVKYKDISVGKGDTVVTRNSKVDIQCSGRLLNLNGVSFYNTKNNNPDGFGAVPLSLELGKGQAVPGLEAGLIGMRKSGIRRIIVPQELAYNKYPDLEPRPTSVVDQRALDSVVKNPRRDAAILFDVQLERLK
ncbi:peptidyl-prolyl isomerase [Nitzschia inconspicua]|uniref:peptidylprolyl isomerase n=1 Tax=Nitzschia inconspicua TaxID=303405 RepID=A0A9K3LS89_9STRA|nr:peptidyl-prolyl isomerase [Nitzschia inconspicua]